LAFISLLIVCSASWFIKNYTDGLFGWTDWERTDDEWISNIDHYTSSAVAEDTSGYFTSGDRKDAETGESYYIYDGTSKEPVLTLTGAQALYGDRQGELSDADFLAQMNGATTRPYTVQWEAGTFYNQENDQALKKAMFTDDYEELRGVIAGKHFYRIIDNATGSVICYKHAVRIDQDVLEDVEVSADRAYAVGEKMTSKTVKVQGTTSKEPFETINLLPDGIVIDESMWEDTTFKNRTYSKQETIDNTPLNNNLEVNVFAKNNPNNIANKIKQQAFINNYSNTAEITATYTFEILATCKDSSNKYYPTLCVALAQTFSSKTTIYAEASITNGTDTYSASPTHGDAHPFTHKICHERTLQSNVTVLVQNGTNTSTSVSDDFSLFSGSAFEYNVEPTDDLSKTYTTAYYDTSGTDKTSKFLKNKVLLSNKLTINGTLFIAANINAGGGGYHAGQVCGDYAQLDVIDGGSIEVGAGGTVNCFGFIKEAKINDPSDQPGDIVFDNGSNLLMPFILYEFRGGTVSSGMQNKSNDTFFATPFHRFGFASIDASFTIIGGAKMEAMAALTAVSQQANAKATVISTGNGSPLITLPEGASLEVTYKSEETVDNLCGQISLKFDAGGPQTIQLNMLDINKSIMGQEISVSTNGAYLPISYLYDIELHNGNYNFEAQKIKVFPGGRIFVAEDASVEASSIILYDEFPAIGTQGNSAGRLPFPSQVSEAGKLEIAGSLKTESLGGKVDIAPDSLGASLEITNSASISDSYELANKDLVTDYKFGNYYYHLISADASGYVASGGTVSDKNLEVEEYSVYDSDSSETEKLAWHYQSDILINYYDENGAKAQLATDPAGKNIWSDVGWLIDDSLPDPPPGTHYTFGGWYLDSECQQPLVEKLIYADTDIYAKWDAKTYTATIYNVYPDKPNDENKSISFTIEDQIETSQSMSGTEEYNFGGWYTDASCDEEYRHKAETISGKDLYDNGGVLYIKWIGEQTYTITFESEHHTDEFGGTATVTQSEVDSGTALSTIKPYTTDYKDDKGESHYFSHWEYNGEKITNISEAMFANGNPTITAVWLEKSSITFKSATTLEAYAGENGLIPYYNAPIYYVPGNISLPDLKANDAASTTNLYYFISWDLDSVTPGDSYDLFELDGETKLVKDITITVTWGYKYYVTITSTNGESVTGLANGQYYPGPSVTGIKVSPDTGFKNATISVIGTSGATYSNGTLTFPPQANDHITVQIQTSSESCIASGTLITLADGTQKRVEDLVESDVLLVFDHETGRFVEAPIVFIERDGWAEYNVINLKFSDGRVTRLIYEHGLFDLTLNKYVYITEENCTEFIGHEFAVIDGDGWTTVTLTEAFVTTEYVGCYSLVTAYHLNYFIDGLFSMPGGIEGLFNIFEYGDGMVYDEEQMQKDIETYGLYTYEDFAEYIPEEVYNAFPAAYLKVSVGKGYLTFDDILAMIERYVVGNGLM